jgi:hypothetical protein
MVGELYELLPGGVSCGEGDMIVFQEVGGGKPQADEVLFARDLLISDAI